MAKNIYDSNSISMFPISFSMELPDGYRIDTEYDDDLNESYHLRGGFYINDEGNEDFAFTCGFTSLNISLKVEEDADPQKLENLRNPSHPDFAFNQVIDSVKENLEEQYGNGKCLKLFNSQPFSALMKYYQPFSIFGVTLDTYLVFYWVEVDENTALGLTSVYRNDDSDAEEYHKHLLRVIKSIRVDGKPVDTGKLTPKKLEKALDLEANEDVEAMDLGLSIGINFQNGDEETRYTLNSDGSITDETGEEIVLPSDEDDDDESMNDFLSGLFSSQEYVNEVEVSDADNSLITVDGKWTFKIPEGLELKTDAEHVDVIGNNTTAKYAVQGMKQGGRYFFDYELHDRFDDGISTDVDVIGCRYDNDVLSGNANQKIIKDDDELYVDLVNKPVFFSRSMAIIRVRGEGIRSWDFTASVDNNDQELADKWDKIKVLVNEIAESIQLVNSTGQVAKKKKNKEEFADSDFIISNGVLRKYIGKKTDIVIPSGVTEIADSTFSGFSKLKSVVIPEGVKRIGRRCFENCSKLIRCYLPESLEELGGYAFVDCHELKEVYLSDKIKVLGDSAFSECFALKDVKIPEKIKVIDAFTFKNCHAFTHISIPNGVESIGVAAFAGCTNLEYLFVPDSVKNVEVDFMNNHPFSGSEKLIIHTPKGSYTQKLAEDNGLPFKNEDKGTITVDNTNMRSNSAAAESKSGKSVSTDDGFAYVNPDESLYPHLISKQTPQGLGFLGIQVISNPSGTDYAFYIMPDDIGDDASEEFKEAVYKLSDSGAADYKLSDRAVEMRSVFHVSPDIFDFRHDRERELAEGYMQRAYMMSGIRSFAWTLSKYCDDNKTEPGRLSLEQIQNIVSFIADRDWLNYDGGSYCKSLCGTQDLHVYYIPDNTDASVRTAFEPSEQEIEEAQNIKAQFSSYNPIFSQTGSLDGLRNDLEYIYPAINKLYEAIKEQRDYNEHLEGNDADIVYAWCALAYAARAPFFSEDGPSMYMHSQIESEEELQKKQEEALKRTIEQRAEMSKKFMASYGKYFEKNPDIQFNDKKFVFTGWKARIYELGDTTEYANLIEDRGGLTRKNVSGVTDYLVVDPAGAGDSKISAAIENQRNGKPIKIILLDDLKKALGLPSDDDGLPKGIPSASKTVVKETAISTSCQNEVASHAGRNEEDAVKMFGILTVELTRGQANKGRLDFYNEHRHKFPGYESKELGDLRDIVRKEMKDKERYEYYASKFLKLPIEDRFECTTRLVINLHNYVDYYDNGMWSIQETAEWYMPDELHEAIKLMQDILDEEKASTDEWLSSIVRDWTQFSTASKYLKVIIDSPNIDLDFDDPTSWFFQKLFSDYYSSASCWLTLENPVYGGQSVKVADYFPTYWNVTDKQIWEAAFKNGVIDQRLYGEDGDKILAENMPRIREHCLGKVNDNSSLEKETRDQINRFITDINNWINSKEEPKLEKKIEASARDIFYDACAFSWCRENLAAEADMNNMAFLSNLLNSDEDSRTIFRTMPGIIAEGINKARIERIEKENAEKYAEADELLSSGILSEISKAETLLKSIKDYRDSNVKLERCKQLLKEAKTDQYNEALALFKEGTEEPIIRAIDKLEELGEYEDAPNLAKQYREHLEKERIYQSIIDDVSSKDLDKLRNAKSQLEGLEGFKNTDEVLISCNSEIETLMSRMYDDAIALANMQTEEALGEAKSIMLKINPYRDSENRIVELNQLLANESIYKSAIEDAAKGDDLSSLRKAKEQFASISGYKDADEKAADCEKQIEMLCKYIYIKASEAERTITTESQEQAISLYEKLQGWDDSNERINQCRTRINTISQIASLDNQIESDRKELAGLSGAFKKKERRTVEERIKEAENNASNLRTTLNLHGVMEEPSVNEVESIEKPKPAEATSVKRASKKSRKGLWIVIALLMLALVTGALFFTGVLYISPDVDNCVIEEYGPSSDPTAEKTITIDNYMTAPVEENLYTLYKITNTCGEDIWSIYGDVSYENANGKEICISSISYKGLLKPNKSVYVLASSYDVKAKKIARVKLTEYEYNVGQIKYRVSTDTMRIEKGANSYEDYNDADYDSTNIATFEINNRGIDEYGGYNVDVKVKNNGNAPISRVGFYIDYLDSEGNILNSGSGYIENELAPSTELMSESSSYEDIEEAGINKKIVSSVITGYSYYLDGDDANGNNYYSIDLMNGMASGEHYDD